MTHHWHRYELAFTPPYDWRALLGFLAARAIAGVEEVEGEDYRRTLRATHEGQTCAGLVALRSVAGGSYIEVALSSTLMPLAAHVLERLARFTDVACDPAAVNAALGAVSTARPGLRVPGALDGFELAVRAILGQQISVAAARTLAGRFAATFGQAVDGIRYLFPTSAEIARQPVENIARLGIVRARAQAILDLAGAMHQGRIDLHWGADPIECARQLTAIRGIGEWTAQYLALRVLGWRDAFPHGDLAVRKALGGISAKDALRHAERWRPFRAYATMHLWQSLHESHA